MMYEKWNDRSPKPSAFESEIHPSHKSAICTLGISPLRGACITALDTITSAKQKRKAHKIDPQIQYGIIQYVGRGLQSTHHRVGEEKAKNTKDYT